MRYSQVLEYSQHKEVDTGLPYSNQEAMQESAGILLDCYEDLSRTKQHLLFPLLGNEEPRQWAHYPKDDVIDHSTGFQYFYHSHSAEDRQDFPEHGHFHLFARMNSGKHSIDAYTEEKFLEGLRSVPDKDSTNASLLCISLDQKGIPLSIFTVNRWVTGDNLLSWGATISLLKKFHITTPGFETTNLWMKAMLGLFLPEIVDLLVRRDLRLAELARERRPSGGMLEDKNIELLSETFIDIDNKISLLNKATKLTN